jgi:putative transposase
LGVESEISKSEVSRICAQLDTDIAAWRERSLAEQATPYVFLDATYCKVRIGDRVVSQAVVIATGVTADGHREVLGIDVGDGETEDFWSEFLRSLHVRGRNSVQTSRSPRTNATAARVDAGPRRGCRRAGPTTPASSPCRPNRGSRSSRHTRPP